MLMSHRRTDPVDMAMMDSLEQKVALITGASRGIGSATARALAAEGVDVVLLARSEDRLRELADALETEQGVDTHVAATDITDADAVNRAVQAAVTSLGRLDIVVNNAAAGTVEYDDRFEESSVAECGRIIETNLTGAINVTHATLSHVRERQGNVIFVGSSAAMRPRPGSMIYSASKWGLRGFALSLEAHVGQDGIAVTSIHTSLVRTERWADVPPGAGAEPEEIARAVVYAATQPAHSTISELTVHRRDILGKFVPDGVDIDLAFELPEQDSS